MGSPSGNRERRPPSPPFHTVASKYAPRANHINEQGRRGEELERSTRSIQVAESRAPTSGGCLRRSWGIGGVNDDDDEQCCMYPEHGALLAGGYT